MGKSWTSRTENPTVLDLEAEAQKMGVEYPEQPIARIGENLEGTLAGKGTLNISDIMTLLKPHVPMALKINEQSANVTRLVDRFAVDNGYFKEMQTALTNLKLLNSTDSLTTFLNITEILPTPGRRKMRLWAAGVGHPPTLTLSDFYFAYEPGQELVLGKLDYADFRYFLLNPEEGTYENGAVKRERLIGSQTKRGARAKKDPKTTSKMRQRGDSEMLLRNIYLSALSLFQYQKSILQVSFLWSIRSGDLEIPDHYWRWILYGYNNESQDGSNMSFEANTLGPIEERMKAIRAEAEDIQ